jgi:hypothetical protein
VYVEDGRIQLWYIEYDEATDTARLGIELLVMKPPTRESLGETWYSFDEARPLVHPDLWELACARLAELRGS